MAIPVIDFSKINGTGEERAKTMAQIANGCEEWGFFQVIYTHTRTHTQFQGNVSLLDDHNKSNWVLKKNGG